MITANPSRTPAVSRADLEHQGFTNSQIERLEQLRAIYPYVEFVDSDAQWQRLVFLQWLCRTSLADPATR